MIALKCETIKLEELKEDFNKIITCNNKLMDKEDDFTGFVDLPLRTDEQEIETILKIADEIRKKSKAVVFIGIGGSYIGARAAIDLFKEDEIEVYYAGNHINNEAYIRLFKEIEGKDLSICMISKSGGTLEPNVGFALMKKWLKDRYGEAEAANRIYVITDKSKGIMREEVDKHGYTNFVIPDDIGGRYSIMTPVGLLPMAVAGIDIRKMIEGTQKAFEEFKDNSLENKAILYALYRHKFYEENKVLEIFEHCEPKLRFFVEWLKQLYGESNGKNGVGVFPTSLKFPRDLHSMEQFLQDGSPCFFETFLDIKEIENTLQKNEKDVIIEEAYTEALNGKSLKEIEGIIIESVKEAHLERGIPHISIEIDKLDAYTFGYLIYFFQKSCALSGYLTDVFPFDQPGVELYKAKIKASL